MVRSALALLAFLIRVVLLLVGLAFAFGAIFSLYGFCVCITQPNFRQAKFWFGNMAAAGGLSYLTIYSAKYLEFLLPWIFDDDHIFGLLMPKPLKERQAIEQAKREGKPLASYASRLRTLSVTTAEKICEGSSSRWLEFFRLQRLTEEAAAVLVERHRGALQLSGLKTLNPALAASLARAQGPLLLDALKTLPDEVAEALARHSGWLTLDGLPRITPTAAAALARRPVVDAQGGAMNRLGLGGLKRLPEDVAAALVAYRGDLAFSGLTELSASVARLLAAHLPAEGSESGFSLHLDELTRLSAEAAAAIATYPGGLSLDGIRSAEPDCLRFLARHNGGPLSLGRLRTMPDDVAAIFAARQEVLLLPRLDEISPSSRAVLESNQLIVLPDESRRRARCQKG